MVVQWYVWVLNEERVYECVYEGSRLPAADHIFTLGDTQGRIMKDVEVKRTLDSYSESMNF